ncbi:hypothetical protein INR49_012932 [Caranx melampygus]|nr:hypothetical protein INR49_012932 [Caranx melampygus]
MADGCTPLRNTEISRGPMFSSSSFLISVRIALITWISLCSLSTVLTTAVEAKLGLVSLTSNPLSPTSPAARGGEAGWCSGPLMLPQRFSRHCLVGDRC